MATTMRCDKCERALGERTDRQTGPQTVLLLGMANIQPHQMDLCPDCARAVVAFIRGRVTSTLPERR